jgi:hypothetical protein
VRAGIIGTLALAILVTRPAYAAPPQQSKDLQAQFDQEQDVVRRAKLMIRLGNQFFHEAREALKTQDSATAEKLVEKLRDDAQACDSQLEAHSGNPEQHPAGFKDLQIAMRQSLRRLDDMMNSLTSDEQPPFQAVRQDLEEIDQRLIRQLFPHQPAPPGDSPAAK